MDNTTKDLQLEYSQKKFKKLIEYTFNTQLTEDDENPSDMDMPAPAMDATNTQDAAPMSNQPQTEEVPVEGGEEGMNMPPDDSPMGDDMDFEEIEMDSDDENVEEVDVTDLVNDQGEIKTKLSTIDTRFNSLIGNVEKLASKIDDIIVKTEKTEAELNNINKEIVKRNPTDTEKLNIRSADSFPFNVRPNEFWEKKAKERPNYAPFANNDIGPSDEIEYVLKQSDIDDEPFDYNEIIKSFDDKEKGFNNSLSKMFGY